MLGFKTFNESNDFQRLTCLWQMYEKLENVNFTFMFLMSYRQKSIKLNLAGCSILVSSLHESNDVQC